MVMHGGWPISRNYKGIRLEIVKTPAELSLRTLLLH